MCPASHPTPGVAAWPQPAPHRGGWPHPLSSLLGQGRCFCSGGWEPGQAGKRSHSRQALAEASGSTCPSQGGSPGRVDTRGWRFPWVAKAEVWTTAGPGRRCRTRDPDSAACLGPRAWLGLPLRSLPLRSLPGAGPAAEDVRAPHFLAAQASQSFPEPALPLETRRRRPQPCKQ